MSTEAPAMTTTDDSVVETCRRIQGSGRPTLRALNPMLANPMTHSDGLTFSDLKHILDCALRDGDKSVVEMASLAIRIKQSASAGQTHVAYIGLGRNPANLAITGCLLVRFGDKVYSYKPATNITPLQKWDERIRVILRTHAGVAEFNSLVANRIIMKVGPAWSIASESMAVASLRDAQYMAIFADGSISTSNTKLTTDYMTTTEATLLSTAALHMDNGDPIIILSGEPLWDAIASGTIEIKQDKLHASLIGLATRKMIGS